jgi:signal peptidase I
VPGDAPPLAGGAGRQILAHAADSTTIDAGRRRRPWLAALLTLFVPGLGHLYAGEPKRGLAVYLGNLLLIAGFLIGGVVKTFGGLIAFVVTILLYLLWAIWDAARVARPQRDYALRPFNRWYVYLAVVLVAGLVSRGLLALSPVRSFRITSGSMEPAVLIGDHVYADLAAYRSAGPARGELVVYASPENPAILAIKRVIGLAGEVIEIRDKQVLLGGRPLADPWGRHSAPEVFRREPGKPEVLAMRDNLGPLRIPAGTVFVLGDERDNSYDSRFFGPVPLSSLRGRLLYVYWSPDRSRIGKSLR